MSPGQTPGLSPGTKWVCPREKPRFSPYFTQWKPSLSLGQTRFVPGTFRGRRAAERVLNFMCSKFMCLFRSLSLDRTTLDTILDLHALLENLTPAKNQIKSDCDKSEV